MIFGVGILAAGIVALSTILALAGKNPPVLGTIGHALTGKKSTPTTCPLTGVPKKHIPNRPALAVKVENLPEARPQAGLNSTDVVYEEPVEGGITRFIAIFQCRSSSRVGPVRSARMTDSMVLPQYSHPVFGYAGGVAQVVHAVDAAGVKDENFNIAVNAYQRDPNRPEPHNVYTSTQALWKAAAKAHEGAPQPVFQYGDLPGTTKKVGFVHLGFSSYSDVYWRWNSHRQAWLRFHGTVPHTIEGGGQVSATNVVVQVVKIRYDGLADVIGTPSPEAVTVGSGKAYVFRDGRMIVGKWTRDKAGDLTQFQTRSGDTIELAPGNTWVELFPKNLKVEAGK
jgi:hypothetical protein